MEQMHSPWEREGSLLFLFVIIVEINETIEHLFLHCPFARQIWNWLFSKLNCAIDYSSLHSLISISDLNGDSQVQDVIIAAITFSFYRIWSRRNNSLSDFNTLKQFSIIGHPRKADNIKQVWWSLPVSPWINFGAHNLDYFWWDSPPAFISLDLLRYIKGLPSYKFK